jgi:hypothetical protein
VVVGFMAMSESVRRPMSTSVAVAVAVTVTVAAAGVVEGLRASCVDVPPSMPMLIRMFVLGGMQRGRGGLARVAHSLRR